MWWRKKRLPVTVTTLEVTTPREIAGYLAQLAARLDERPEPMRVRFNVPRDVVLDLLPDGRLAVRMEGHRRQLLDLRHRWIADHPVPLSLFRCVLYIDPVDANRFRVNVSVPFVVPYWAYPLVVLLITLVIVLVLGW